MWRDGFGLPLRGSRTEESSCTRPFFAAAAPDPRGEEYSAVHVDGHSWLAVLIHLGLDGAEKTGTAFWRHRRYRFETAYNGPEPLSTMSRIDAVFGTDLLGQIREPLLLSGARDVASPAARRLRQPAGMDHQLGRARL